MSKNHRELVDWTKEQASAFGQMPVLAKHRMHELDMFSDDALIELLEKHPKQQLQAFTMGTDPVNLHEWKPVDTAGVSGETLYEAVARGRLWVHLFRMQMVPAYREVMDGLFASLSESSPSFRPFNVTGTLLISSPNALVYYHADAQPNLLWHIRGSKRVWVYPAGDKSLIDQELMEDIFAAYMDEEVPYKPEFDRKAAAFDLVPGDVISWPQNAPHRVTNLGGINISLSTVYETEESHRRKLVYCANRFFRRSYSIPVWSTKETGIGSSIKRFAYRGFRKAGLIENPRGRGYISEFRIDPNGPNGVQRISEGPVLTEFSKQEFVLKRDGSGQVFAAPLNRR